MLLRRWADIAPRRGPLSKKILQSNLEGEKKSVQNSVGSRTARAVPIKTEGGSTDGRMSGGENALGVAVRNESPLSLLRNQDLTRKRRDENGQHLEKKISI